MSLVCDWIGWVTGGGLPGKNLDLDALIDKLECLSVSATFYHVGIFTGEPIRIEFIATIVD
jgi:hypothetical protein